MEWVKLAVLAVLAVVAFLAWGFIRITKRAKDAALSVFKVEQKGVPGLVDECIRVCRDKLGLVLDLNDLQTSAENLDYILEPKQRTRMKTAFELPDHPGHFVLPFGAYLGELVRTHMPEARWVPREGGGLAMEIPQVGTTLTMHPFDKVLKHSAVGKPGEMIAYLNVALGRQ